MLNEAQVSLTGYVATQPVTKHTKTGIETVSMRVAWTERRQDKVSGEWADGNTSFVTVICWRKLAANVAICVRKGDPVVVKGKLSVRPYDKDGIRRIAVEVEASSVGHDISHGVAKFSRVRPPTGMTASEYAATQGQPAGAAAGNGAADTDGRYAVPAGSARAAEEDTDDSFFNEAAIAESLGEDADAESELAELEGERATA